MRSLKLPEAVSHMTDDLLQDQVYSKNRVVLGLYYALRNEVTGSEFWLFWINDETKFLQMLNVN